MDAPAADDRATLNTTTSEVDRLPQFGPETYEELSDRLGDTCEAYRDLRRQFDGLTLSLAQLVKLWTDDAESRRARAERMSTFGPAMMMGTTEASVLAACAEQVTNIIRIVAD